MSAVNYHKATAPDLSGKRARSKSCSDDDFEGGGSSKRCNFGFSGILPDLTMHNKSRIYNFGVRKKPAELFRKDLISAMKMADSEQLNREDYLPITDQWREEWEKGVQVPVNPDFLKQRETNVKVVAGPSGGSSSPAKQRQPPDSPFKMPKGLLKFEPERDTKAARYEIDLVDKCWLESMREAEEAFVLTDDLFEDIMNELEHQCARNMKAKHVGIEYDDHIICDVCRSPDGETDNEMVFCDSCNICVHQACYGIVTVPDGEWLCNPCREGDAQSQKCILCPNPGGAFKPTNTGKWAHVACALWIPEVTIGNVSSMEPVTKIKQIPSSRWNLICNICNIKQGAPIQCSVKQCKAAYHVTCAFREKLRMRAIVEKDNKGIKLKSFCRKHSSDRDESPKADGDETTHDLTNSNQETDKNNRFWMYIDSNEINQAFVSKLQKKYSDLSQATVQLIIDLVYQYWKIKRTSNNGLPLIRVVSSDTIEELQKERRNDILRLRVNLERIRNLSYMICRREKNKRSWVRSHQEITEKALCVLTGVPLPSSSSSSDGGGDEKPSIVHEMHLVDDITSQEKLSLIRDVLSCDNIYNEDEQADIKTLRTKRLLREINRLVKVEKARRLKPNPYAKLYFGKRKSESNETAAATATTTTCDTKDNVKAIKEEPSTNRSSNNHAPTMPTTPTKTPLKSKCVPTNVQRKPEIDVKLEALCEQMDKKLKGALRRPDRKSSPLKSPIKSSPTKSPNSKNPKLGRSKIDSREDVEDSPSKKARGKTASPTRSAARALCFVKQEPESHLSDEDEDSGDSVSPPKRFDLRKVAARVSQHYYSLKEAAIRAANGIDVTRQNGLDRVWF